MRYFDASYILACSPSTLVPHGDMLNIRRHNVQPLKTCPAISAALHLHRCCCRGAQIHCLLSESHFVHAQARAILLHSKDTIHHCHQRSHSHGPSAVRAPSLVNFCTASGLPNIQIIPYLGDPRLTLRLAPQNGICFLANQSLSRASAARNNGRNRSDE